MGSIPVVSKYRDITYFDVITVSYKFLPNNIITISILLQFIEEFAYTELYELSKDGWMSHWIYSCLVSCGQTLFKNMKAKSKMLLN